jgi:hypothetical protein
MGANYSESTKSDETEMVLVPKRPTKEMLDAAWADPLTRTP